MALAVFCLLLGGCDGCRRQPAAQADNRAARQPAPQAARRSADALHQAVLDAARQARATAGPPSSGDVAAPGTHPASGDCVVVADANPDYGAPPLDVSLSAEAECSAGEPQYTWDFGDGSPPSAEANPTHTYAQAGDFLATVTVKGPDGATGSDEVDVTLDAAAVAEP